MKYTLSLRQLAVDDIDAGVVFYYRIENQEIHIIAVHDARRNPSIWMNRP